jgi:hypothetical protein
MQDNSTYDEMELLIRYMDGELTEEERTSAERMLQENASLHERYENLVAAKESIRSKGLKEKVQALHQQFYQQNEAKETAKVIRPSSFGKTFMRIAAVLILVVAGYFAYEYTTTNNENVYAENFVSYQLPVTRGDQNANEIEHLYNEKDYDAVIDAVNRKPQKTQEDFFLKGQSYLQKNNAIAAIAAFKVIEELNFTSKEKYFEQETDYYLLLAYLKANEIDAARDKLKRITSDKHHIYYNKANEISKMQLEILKWKQ